MALNRHTTTSLFLVQTLFFYLKRWWHLMSSKITQNQIVDAVLHCFSYFNFSCYINTLHIQTLFSFVMVFFYQFFFWQICYFVNFTHWKLTLFGQKFMQISIINPVTNRLKIYEYFYFQIKSIHSFISPNIYEDAVSIVNIRKLVMSHSKKTRTFSNYFNNKSTYSHVQHRW